MNIKLIDQNRLKICLKTEEVGQMRLDIANLKIDDTATKAAMARLLGQELIVYPRYAKLLQKGYADLPEEYRLLTALLNTDGTTVGITQGANTANARYVAGQIA